MTAPLQLQGLHDNALRMLQAVGEFNAGNTDAVGRLWADDCVWHAAGDNAMAGDFRGREAVADWFVRARDLADDGVTSEPIDVFSDDTHLVMLHRLRGRRGDRWLEQTHMNAWRFEDGLAVEGWFLPESTADWDAWIG